MSVSPRSGQPRLFEARDSTSIVVCVNFDDVKRQWIGRAKEYIGT